MWIIFLSRHTWKNGEGTKGQLPWMGQSFPSAFFVPLMCSPVQMINLWSQHGETQRSCCVPIQEKKWCSYGYFAAHDCVPKGQDHIKRLITSINNSLFLKITNETENHFVLLRFVFKQQMWFFFQCWVSVRGMNSGPCGGLKCYPWVICPV